MEKGCEYLIDETQYKFSRVYHELNLQKDAKEKLAEFSKELKILLEAEGIKAKVVTDHHMTLSYYIEIYANDMLKTLILSKEEAKKLENMELLNRNKKYDQSIHKKEIRKSKINGKTYLVLVPHNPDNIYKNLKEGEERIPHITLAELDCSIERARELLPKIKNIMAKYIQDRGIAVDFSEIITHTR
ncbi:MAG: hypothetical protein PHU61_01940 [Candidatus Absconditabacteria bacterium]|nr:hypothetical protein [Candidatus Absconditabacteria bacterium]MDD3868471.1 hypothetical protein [Candidatus Absconditabacteria bacterium]MDD4713955.1 hypothetical protein [Candidatus Absconditabacteria bacterium]